MRYLDFSEVNSVPWGEIECCPRCLKLGNNPRVDLRLKHFIFHRRHCKGDDPT